MAAEAPRQRSAQAGAVPVIVALLLPLCGAASDWPQFRGANHDGISTDRITTTWTGSVTNPVWRVPVSNALCSLAVSGGQVFTQTRRTTNEVCVALNTTNGAELWARVV